MGKSSSFTSIIGNEDEDEWDERVGGSEVVVLFSVTASITFSKDTDTVAYYYIIICDVS